MYIFGSHPISSTRNLTSHFDRAKKIQNKATINESPTDRLIRELKEENARLLAMLKKQSGGDTSGREGYLNCIV